MSSKYCVHGRVGDSSLLVISGFGGFTETWSGGDTTSVGGLIFTCSTGGKPGEIHECVHFQWGYRREGGIIGLILDYMVEFLGCH